MTDLNDIFIDDQIKKEVLEYKGQKIEIEIKQISWSRKNDILGECFTFSDKGEMKFNFSKYAKLMLKEMIVKAPWGETNELFFLKIKSDFGDMLNKFVPKALEEMSDKSFFVKE